MRAAGLAGISRSRPGTCRGRRLPRDGPAAEPTRTRPTAIFAANDSSCVGALSAATEMGVRVPDDLSLVGFDNSALARLRALWLTSVDGAARGDGPGGGAHAARPDRAARRAARDPADSATARSARLDRSGPHLT